MANMADFDRLTPLARKLTTPTDTVAHDGRISRLRTVANQDVSSSPYFNPELIIDTFTGTQFDGENHRRLTPWLQENFANYRAAILRNIDGRTVGRGGGLVGTTFDVIIIGTGPHGTAVAANIRELDPKATILMIEKNDRVGGQFRAYGDKPAYMMNSRVRKANRMLKPLPGTPGSINPLGMYAPLELSDVVTGNYAMNNDLGDITAINAFLSATTIIVKTEVIRIEDNPNGSKNVILAPNNPVGVPSLTGRIVVDATGIKQESTLKMANSNSQQLELAKLAGRFFDTASFYAHFASNENPLEAFHNHSVMLIGGGDSALTVLEALVGNLPPSSYGRFGVGRYQPSKITWMGAPRETRGEFDDCLRSRYKNGILQILPTSRSDRSSLVRPMKVRVESLSLKLPNTTVRTVYGGRMEAEVIIDCTNTPRFTSTTKRISRRSASYDYRTGRYLQASPSRTVETQTLQLREQREGWNPDFIVGPYSAQLDPAAQKLVSRLGVKENTAALWVTMPRTDEVSKQIAKKLA